MTGRGAARDRLAVALDVPTLDEARQLIRRLDGRAGWLKVGLELHTAAGPDALRAARECARVFLDLKLHDIPQTAARATAAAVRHGAEMLTLHAAGGRAMLEAARAAADGTAAERGTRPPLLVAVTVLTSVDPGQLAEVGVRGGLPEQVARLVDLARAAALDGAVASPREAAAVRARAGDRFRIVTPGIRPAGSARGDQERIATPAEALRAGADLIVVGRPITRAADPAEAAEAVVSEIESALEPRQVAPRGEAEAGSDP